MSSTPAVRVDALLAGKARAYTRPGTLSGIDKRPLAGEVRIGELGIAGDEQGDPRVHGGPDKAVHHYAFDHYAAWRDDLGALPLLQTPGAFGENISTQGLTEADVCLGDRFALGDALLEISQGRQPCWKLNDRFDVPDMARRVQATGRTGWYYRVLRPGSARAGDALALAERPYPGWTLQRLAALLYGRTLDPALLEPALRLPLVPSWRKLIERRLQQGAVEDWSRRIDGPASD
ncbi:MOSC domain-containing protein [Thermomonas brevis]|uniref:MOSC domain-containing protein n=1 Tax=Thermomonas brevis TaxID=215691 RepID=A0A7G9QSH7_9GAMM|nr:MOSC domain-containing protein [Thermomonas brevis]QNN46302.1 MOSC domain-containing protein [Thermomonas brevis]